MEAKIIQIGNSHGVRLPKSLMKRAGVRPGELVLLDVTADRRIILTPPKANPRTGWDAAFRRARSQLEKENLWGDLPLDEALDK
jgi:antitoxin MazE